MQTKTTTGAKTICGVVESWTDTVLTLLILLGAGALIFLVTVGTWFIFLPFRTIEALLAAPLEKKT